MSLIPDRLITAIRGFSDLTVGMFGIACDLYVPTNLNTLASADIYLQSSTVTYRKYANHKIWIEWFAKDIQRLRLLGLFTEDDAPIVAWLPNNPEVILHSYIQVDTRFIPDRYDTDKFEIVDVIAKNTYDSEVLRCYKLAPMRTKT